MAGDKLHSAGLAQGVDLLHARGFGLKQLAPVQQRDAGGGVGRGLVGVGAERNCLLQRSVVATHDHQVLGGKALGRVGVVKQLAAQVVLDARQRQAARFERAHACGNEDRPGQKAQFVPGVYQKAAIALAGYAADFVPEVKAGVKWRDLRQQAFGEFAPGANANALDRYQEN